MTRPAATPSWRRSGGPDNGRMIAASGAAVALFPIGAARLAAERPDPMPGRRAVPRHGAWPAWGGTMTDEPAERGLPFATAAERYGSPDLVAAWHEARAKLAPYKQPGRRVRHPGYWSPGGATRYRRDFDDYRAEPLADHLAREAAAHRSALEAAASNAWGALRADLIERLARGELVADGTIYQAGSLAAPRKAIPPESWAGRFRFQRGNAIAFGPKEAATLVHDVLILPATAVPPTPAPAAKDERSPTRYPVPHKEVARVAVQILEEHKADLIKTNGLRKAATTILSLMELKRPYPVETIESYIRSRYRELSKEMGVRISPRSTHATKG